MSGFRRPSALPRLGVLTATAVVAMALSLVVTTPAEAVPAAPTLFTLTQPDGQTFRAKQVGDEWNNEIETARGFTIKRDTHTGYWEYVQRGGRGRLVLTGLRAGIDSPTRLAKHLRPAVRYRTPNPSLAKTSSPEQSAPNLGTQHELVILVDFANQDPLTTPADWNNRFFGPTESVADYYDEVSYGQLTIAPAAETSGTVNDGVVGWLHLPGNHPDTGSNTGIANQQLTKQAIVAADPYVDFAAYDADDNGYLSAQELHITVIPAGCEASYGIKYTGCKWIWAHEWSLDGVGAPTVDGIQPGVWSKGGRYTQFGEMHFNHQATLGVMVHELGHDLGLPDMYDIDNSSAGVGKWSIMSYGSWQALPTEDAGATPSHPDPFSRSYEGWLTPQQVTGAQLDTAIGQVETSPTAWQFLDNPLGVDWTFNQASGSGEYYLVENREPVGYDAALPGCGLLVWHIDETRTSGNDTNANDSRRLVDLEEADGLDQLDDLSSYGDAGDPFPGSTVNQAFDDASEPNSRLYGGAPTGVSLTNISSCGANVTADLAMNTPAPMVTQASAPTSVQGDFEWGFTRPVTGITKSALNVVRVGISTPLSGSLTCLDASDAVVACDTGEVFRAKFTPTTPVVPGEYYFMNANPTTSDIVAYDDATPLLSSQNYVRAQTEFSFDQNPIGYSWATVNNKQALGGSFVREQFPGASETFRAKGRSIGMVTLRGPDGGKATVLISTPGQPTVTKHINLYAAQAGSKRFIWRGLPMGRHIVTVSVDGSTSPKSSNTWVRIDGTVTGKVTHKSPVLAATWPNYPGIYAYSASKGASISFTFRGTGFGWTHMVGPNNGKAQVAIDGVGAGTVDLYNKNFVYDQNFVYGGLDDTMHTVTITTLGTHRAASSGAVVTIQGLTVN